MSEAKKKFLGLFRSKSASEKASKDSKPEKDHHSRRRRDEPPTTGSHRRRPRRSNSPVKTLDPKKSVGNRISAQITPAPAPLSKWPPHDFSLQDSFSQGKAMELIASEAPVYKGYRHSIPHASEEYYRLYATCGGNGDAGNDRSEPYQPAFAAASLRISGPEAAEHPWETLEHPSLAFCYGSRPGTITLNHWVSLSGNPNPAIELRDPGVKPRDVELSTILERLIYLEDGFEEDYEDLMYKNLYKNLLRDPERSQNPHKAMEKQIADLIIVLSRPEWIDFSRPENQVVAKFFANATYTDRGRYKAFFHQLLLSTELDLRINSKHHAAIPKGKLLTQLPPCISWDLAVSRKWRECMAIEKFNTGGDPKQIRFHLRIKRQQIKALRKFARAMKWPNLAVVDAVLKERGPDAQSLENRSSDAMSYFTGMILPGRTFPWLIMNSLIDCDEDDGTNALAALTHMHPNSGFQYKSTTYWSSTSIVGKVLAPTCQEIGGWIGPARPAPDLDRIQIARIRQRPPKQHLSIRQVESMTIGSDPLGPPAKVYPVADYELLLPDADDIVDTVRIEKLALKPVSSTNSPSPSPHTQDRPLTFDAAVQFAIDGRSWPLRLSYDVSFISAYPCSRGPHPLFFDYVYKAARVDEILTIKDWGGINGSSSVGASANSRTGTTPLTTEVDDRAPDDEAEKVLVIECFGVADNEVLARAWCSHWGLSAVVADMERTCMGCAIREAYAACLNVVILVEGGGEYEVADA